MAKQNASENASYSLLLPDPDRLVEIEDEFGRTRTVKASEQHLYQIPTSTKTKHKPTIPLIIISMEEMRDKL